MSQNDNIKELMARAQEQMGTSSKEIDAAGGVENFTGAFERVEWDLARDYRAVIEDVTVTIPESGSARLQLVVKVDDPQEWSGNKAWLTFWLTEKAMQWTMKDLTPLFMRAGVAKSDLDIFDAEKLTEQLSEQRIVFSLKPNENNPDFPERRWINIDRGQPLKTNHPMDVGKSKIAKMGEVEEEPFPDAVEAEVVSAPGAPVVVDVAAQIEQTNEVEALRAQLAALENAAPVVAAPAPVQETAAPAPANTGIVLPPGLG